MNRQQEILMLGACEAIKALFPDSLQKRFLLKQTFPYLTEAEVNYWGQFYGI